MCWLLLALSIVFPRDGQVLPPLSRCYIIGSADAGVTNVTVQGRDVPVYRTGAWASTVDLVEGSNTVSVGGTSLNLFVRSAPKKSAAGGAVKPKTFEKLAYAADVAKAHPKGKKPQEISIVIDPGHGGADSGALSPRRFKEKDANLAVARKAAEKLIDRGYRVFMTRGDDRAIPLYDRPKMAHANNADAFISIHHNAPPYDRDPVKARYAVIYAWNDIGENLAQAINRRMVSAMGEKMANNGVQRANYAVTRNPEIPSCLIEVDFITSPEGEEASWDPERQSRVAEAIAEGVSDWVRQ
jgi:N-acetylmuramoyl-L-alanine amidase